MQEKKITAGGGATLNPAKVYHEIRKIIDKSGLSCREYCRRRGVEQSHTTLSKWQNKKGNSNFADPRLVAILRGPERVRG